MAIEPQTLEDLDVPAQNEDLLHKLSQLEFYASPLEMLQTASVASCHPAICPNCLEVTQVRPPENRAYCPACNEISAISCITLAGVDR